MQLTQQQVNKKYYWKYVEISQKYDYWKQIRLYEIRKTSKIIEENMTLWQDVWTDRAYTR